MPAPERRTRTDLIVAAVLAIIVVASAAIVWHTSPTRQTESNPAATPAPVVTPASAVPTTLTELWRTTSSATTAPIIVGNVAVSAHQGTVIGHSPAEGNELWSYSRNLDLCGLIGAWDNAIAVYRDTRGCSQATSLNGKNGERGAARSSDADKEITLSSDGTYVMSRGNTRMETWRSDLVRTMQYGRVDAPANPGVQPRSGCTLTSGASSSSRVAILQQCPNEQDMRLSILNPSPKDSDKPEEYGSVVVPGARTGPLGAKIVAVEGDRTAIYLPAGGTYSSTPQISIYDGSANLINEIPLDLDPQLLSANNLTGKIGSLVTWWTGDQILAFNSSDLTLRFVLKNASGPGTLMAGKYLVPIENGISVCSSSSGGCEYAIPVDRSGYSGVIAMSVIGSTIIEQRGTDLVALG
ncbi:MAG: Rv3212 family protein [Mycobacteriaceae bacterium]